jgi:hypothetical protein
MAKPMFDADALIAQFEGATARQGAQLKKATTDATLAALQGRELSLKNIRSALTPKRCWTRRWPAWTKPCSRRSTRTARR